MRPAEPLTATGQRATQAARALARSMRPRSATYRLTLADHASVLESLYATVASLCGGHGTIEAARQLADDTCGRYARLPNSLGGYFTTSLTTVCDRAERAGLEARKANLLLATCGVRDDAIALASWQHTTPEPARSTGFCTQIKDATTAIQAFTDAIWPLQQRPITDTQTVLTATAALLRSVNVTCLREASLLRVAYAAAPVIHTAPPADLLRHLGRFHANEQFAREALTTAAQAITTARNALTEAAAAARQPARHEQRILSRNLVPASAAALPSPPKPPAAPEPAHAPEPPAAPEPAAAPEPPAAPEPAQAVPMDTTPPPPATGPSRSDMLRAHLERILAVPAPTNHSDRLRDPHPDNTAAFRQLDQVRIMQMLFGRDDVAAAYIEWLWAALREQSKTAVPLTSWDETPVDSMPIGWGSRDIHGFLCDICGEAEWQLIPIGDISTRACGRCARRELELQPCKVWAPRLPPAHGHIADPGLLREERHEYTIDAQLADGTSRPYELGDAQVFLVRRDWLQLTARAAVSGMAVRPRMEITGSTGKEGHRFSFAATMFYDPTPQDTRQAPYGFRFTAGTLTTHGETQAMTDIFALLDTIARGEDAFADALASTHD